jgi:hypothetical protein
MPISYTIDAQRKVVCVKWSGTVTSAEFAEHYRGLLTDEVADACRRCVADLRGCAIEVTGAQVQAAIQSVVRPLLGSRPWRSAIIVTDPVAFGLSRQYAAYSQGFTRCQIFSDEREALAWLLVESVPTDGSSSAPAGRVAER